MIVAVPAEDRVATPEIVAELAVSVPVAVCVTAAPVREAVPEIVAAEAVKVPVAV